MVVLFLSFRIEVSRPENIVSVSATELSLFKSFPVDLLQASYDLLMFELKKGQFDSKSCQKKQDFIQIQLKSFPLLSCLL